MSKSDRIADAARRSGIGGRDAAKSVDKEPANDTSEVKAPVRRGPDIKTALGVSQACQMILNTPAPAPKKFVWALMRNRDRIEPVAKGYEEARVRLLKQYAEVDAQGNVIPDENNSAKWKTKDAGEAFQKEHLELLDLDAEIEFFKVGFEHVPDNIAAAALALLEPIITGGDV